MTRAVIDASALLALILGEDGGESVVPFLADARVSAVNLTEVLDKASKVCGSFAEAERQVARHDWDVVPFDRRQAALAAALWLPTRGAGLALGDRACLALAMSLDAVAVTADKIWATLDLGVRVELVR